MAVFAGLLMIIGATVLVATRSSSSDDARADLGAVSSTSAPVIETVPLPTEPLPTEPLPTPPAEPPSGAATPAGRSEGEDRIAEGDAVAFVVDYYERIADADYATTWELLSPEFRQDRNLTFERYVSYWEPTSIELDDLHFVPGPGPDRARVRFQARYDTGAGMIDEQDEVTLRRLDDGSLIIVEQRTV